MTQASAGRVTALDFGRAGRSKQRRASQSQDPTVLTDVYEEDTNIVIWQRELPEPLVEEVREILASLYPPELSMTVSPEAAQPAIQQALGGKAAPLLCEDAAQLVEMLCCLLGIERVGLRLTALSQAMCPKFHVDHVPCRFVTTYCGVATEWLPHASVDRARLGRGSNGLPDSESGLYRREADIQQLEAGDVALLKGELWEGNEEAGLVHRSPAVPAGESRLLLTLDVVGG